MFNVHKKKRDKKEREKVYNSWDGFTLFFNSFSASSKTEPLEVRDVAASMIYKVLYLDMNIWLLFNQLPH